MSGRASRSKGKRGEAAARLLLQERDFEVHDLTDGASCADFVAMRAGKTYMVEVKNTASIDVPRFVSQARSNCGRHGRWMLFAHLHGTSSWLVMRGDAPPTVWHAKKPE